MSVICRCGTHGGRVIRWGPDNVPLHEGAHAGGWYSHLWRAPKASPKRRRARGGRPRVPIPALVVAYAAALWSRLGTWSAVLRELERTGNGTFARNTLRRRVDELLRSEARRRARKR